jgi:hypothetical protein
MKSPVKKYQVLEHLGSTVTHNSDFMVEIKARTASGNRCLQALKSVMKARDISRKVKIIIYKTVIKPIIVKPVLYVDELPPS